LIEPLLIDQPRLSVIAKEIINALALRHTELPDFAPEIDGRIVVVKDAILTPEVLDARGAVSETKPFMGKGNAVIDDTDDDRIIWPAAGRREDRQRDGLRRRNVPLPMVGQRLRVERQAQVNLCRCRAKLAERALSLRQGVEYRLSDEPDHMLALLRIAIETRHEDAAFPPALVRTATVEGSHSFHHGRVQGTDRAGDQVPLIAKGEIAEAGPENPIGRGVHTFDSAITLFKTGFPPFHDRFSSLLGWVEGG